MDSNIPESPAYGVYISRLVAYARACTNIDDFNLRHKALFLKLLNQGFTIKRLHSKFLKFCQAYQPLITIYNHSVQDIWNYVL